MLRLRHCSGQSFTNFGLGWVPTPMPPPRQPLAQPLGINPLYLVNMAAKAIMAAKPATVPISPCDGVIDSAGNCVPRPRRQVSQEFTEPAVMVMRVPSSQFSAQAVQATLSPFDTSATATGCPEDTVPCKGQCCDGVNDSTGDCIGTCR